MKTDDSKLDSHPSSRMWRIPAVLAVVVMTNSFMKYVLEPRLHLDRCCSFFVGLCLCFCLIWAMLGIEHIVKQVGQRNK